MAPTNNSVHLQSPVGTQNDNPVQETESYINSVSKYNLTDFLFPIWSSGSLLQTTIQKGLLFVTMQFTSGFQLLTRVSSTPDFVESNVSIWNNFDTALCLDLLLSARLSIPKRISDHALTNFMEQRTAGGLWNFHHQAAIQFMPDDVDTSSVVASCLLSLGVCQEEVLSITKCIMESIVTHCDQSIDVFFKKRPIDSKTSPGKYWIERERTDVVVTANYLNLLNKLNIKHLPTHTACYSLIEGVLDSILQGKQSKLCKSYQNHNVVVFFISRLIPVSNYAKTKFQKKVCKFVTQELEQCKATMPISLAGLILAGINSGLMTQNKVKRQLLLRASRKLIILQNKQNCWEIEGLYNAHKRLYFGSLALSSTFAITALEMVRSTLEEAENVLKLEN